jgi:hypothetical protein
MVFAALLEILESGHSQAYVDHVCEAATEVVRKRIAKGGDA